MHPTPLMNNRWETLIPVPTNETHLVYRYRFDFKYNAVPSPRADSVLSSDYTLQIIDQ